MSMEPTDEVVRICQELIRIDSSNYGDGTGPGEEDAAAYVMSLLQEVGLEPELVISGERRHNVFVRTPGVDSSRPALCIHGHLDVVPANAADWSRDPFGGDLADGCVWGRGAVDMKGMDAMMLAVLRHLARTGEQPARDIVWGFFADEEAGGQEGSGWVVRHRPDLFDGVTEAMSEVGGFSVTVESPSGDPARAYLLQTAEKGLAWLKLRAHGRAGHGSMPHDENAVGRLARAIAAIDGHTWPREYIASVRDLLDGLSEMTGIDYTEDDCEDLLGTIPGARAFVQATMSNTVSPTMLSAGYKHNVIPQEATAAIDCRFLPGHYEDLMLTLKELVGEHVEIVDEVTLRDLETEADGDLVEAIRAAIEAEDPGARVLPYCLSGGTDNKQLADLGIRGFGFAPLKLPADLPFAPMFHGIDERVPVDALEFGTRVLGRLVRTC